RRFRRTCRRRFRLRLRAFPVCFKLALELARDPRVGDNQADLPALIEFVLPETLAANERARAIADDCACVKARLEPANTHPLRRLFHLAPDNPDFDTSL